MSALVAATGLRITVENGGREVVHGVDFEVPRGGSVGFVGESGSGKTLICRSLLGLLPPGVAVTGGERPLRRPRPRPALTDRQWRALRGREIAAVFQDPASYLNPSIRVGHQLAEVLRVRLGVGRRDAKRRAIELFAPARAAAPGRTSTTSTRTSCRAGCCSGCCWRSPLAGGPTC